MSVEELTEYGVERMSDSEIRTFLSNQGMGVLGLPAPAEPYLVPLSFGYDGDSTVYLTYILGTTSRKEDLSERADHASFLVYKADSMFNWESVMLTGTLEELPESQWGELTDALANAWSPDVFADADLSRGIKIFSFDIEDQVGLKHAGLPAGFEG